MNTASISESLRWEQRQRLTLIEATVYWSGELCTGSLLNHFGISRVQASKDLTLYQSLCPDNIRYDRNLKRYVITDDFKASFMRGDAREFLQLLKISQDNTHSPLITLADNLPHTELLEPSFRQVKPAVLRIINQAINSQRNVHVSYQSMSHATIVTHTLSPHTLVFDGLRWHIRSYSQTHEEYRDFVLARIQSATLEEPADYGADEDSAWQTWLCVKIGAHPGLTESQKFAVEFDYGMLDGVLEKQVRAPLLAYYLKSMRIGPDDLSREANAQQIVLLNRDELQEFNLF
jgi:predicted DNA-binding transcriptional regulator YafY